MDVQIPSINREQLKELGAHALTAAGGAITLLGLLNLLTPEQVHTLSHSLTGVAAGVADVYKGLCEIGIALGPAVVVVSGIWAAWTKSHPQMIARTDAIPGVSVVKEGAQK